MAVSYKRLFKLMIDKDLKKKDLVSKTGIAYSTIRKLENGEKVALLGVSLNIVTYILQITIRVCQQI